MIHKPLSSLILLAIITATLQQSFQKLTPNCWMFSALLALSSLNLLKINFRRNYVRLSFSKLKKTKIDTGNSMYIDSFPARIPLCTSDVLFKYSSSKTKPFAIDVLDPEFNVQHPMLLDYTAREYINLSFHVGSCLHYFHFPYASPKERERSSYVLCALLRFSCSLLSESYEQYNVCAALLRPTSESAKRNPGESVHVRCVSLLSRSLRPDPTWLVYIFMPFLISPIGHSACLCFAFRVGRFRYFQNPVDQH